MHAADFVALVLDGFFRPLDTTHLSKNLSCHNLARRRFISYHHLLHSTIMFAVSLGRSTLLRSAARSTLQRCYASSLADAVASLKGVNFMSIDQLS